jgi:O-antigen/teichoic acid export membrane protein
MGHDVKGIGGRVMKGAGWIAASRVVINLLGLVNTLVLARLLTPDDFGIVAIATSISLLITSLTELSMAAALINHKKPDETHFQTAFSLNLLRAVVLAAIVAALAPVVAWIYGDMRLMPLLLVIAAASLVGGFYNPKLVVFQRELVFWQEFLLSSSEKVVGLVTATTVAVIWQTYWALIAGAAAGQVVSTLMGYAMISFRPRLTLVRWRELFSFSVWLSLGQAANALSWRFDQMVVGYILGPTQAGFVSLGDRLATLPTREATAPIANTAFPAFTQLRQDPERLRRAFQRVQSLLFAIALPAGVLTTVVAETAVQLALGAVWLPAVIIIQVMATNLAFQTINGVTGPLYMALSRTRELFNRNVLILLIRIPLVLGGLLLGGLPGMLIGRCLNGAASIVIAAAMVRRAIDLPVTELFAVNIRPVLAVVVMAAAAFFTGQAMDPTIATGPLMRKLAAMVAVAAVTYPTTLLSIWLLAGRPVGPEHDFMTLPGKIRARLNKGKS